MPCDGEGIFLDDVPDGDGAFMLLVGIAPSQRRFVERHRHKALAIVLVRAGHDPASRFMGSSICMGYLPKHDPGKWILPFWDGVTKMKWNGPVIRK